VVWPVPCRTIRPVGCSDRRELHLSRLPNITLSIKTDAVPFVTASYETFVGVLEYWVFPIPSLHHPNYLFFPEHFFQRPVLSKRLRPVEVILEIWAGFDQV